MNWREALAAGDLKEALYLLQLEMHELDEDELGQVGSLVELINVERVLAPIPPPISLDRRRELDALLRRLTEKLRELDPTSQRFRDLTQQKVSLWRERRAAR